MNNSLAICLLFIPLYKIVASWSGNGECWDVDVWIGGSIPGRTASGSVGLNSQSFKKNRRNFKENPYLHPQIEKPVLFTDCYGLRFHSLCRFLVEIFQYKVELYYYFIFCFSGQA